MKFYLGVIIFIISMGYSHANSLHLEELVKLKNIQDIDNLLYSEYKPKNDNDKSIYYYLLLLSLQDKNDLEFLSTYNKNIYHVIDSNHYLLPDFYLLVSDFYWQRNEFDLYIDFLNKAKLLYLKKNKNHKLINIYLKISNYYYQNKKYHLSLNFLNKIFKMHEIIIDSPTSFEIELLLGKIHAGLNLHEESINFFQKAYDIHKNKNNFNKIEELKIIENIYQLTINNIKIKNYSTARKYTEEGILLSNQNDFFLYQFKMAEIKIYSENGFFQEAKNSISLINPLNKNYNNVEFLLTKFYIFYYEDKNKNINILKSIIENLKAVNNEERSKDYYYVFYLYFYFIEDYKNSLLYFEKYHEYYSNIFTVDLKNNIYELRKALEYEINNSHNKISAHNIETNKILSKKNNEIEKQRNIIIIASFSIISFILFLLIKNIIIKKQFKKYSEIDELTKIYNRRFISKISAALHKEKNDYSLIIFDLDLFKKVNDNYGHKTGDLVLIKITEKVKKIIRSTDYFGRYGGEEFIIFLPNTYLKDAIDIAEKIRFEIENIHFEKNSDLHVTASFGVNEFNPKLTAEEVFEITDKRLYKAKNNGRNNVVGED
jgi:diguanylate cyclase (GGDEF)-like protein